MLAAAAVLGSALLARSDDVIVEVGRPLPIAVHADDAPLGTHGPSRAVRCSVRFDGVLHVFALAPGHDPFLRVESIGGGATLEDDDRGGGKTPYLELTVHPGDELSIAVAVDVAGGADPVDVLLHVGASPETDATRAAADDARRKLVQLAVASPASRAALRDGLRGIVDVLARVEGAAGSARVVEAFARAGAEASRIGAWSVARDAWSVCVAHSDRVMAPDDPRLQALRGDLGAALAETGDVERAAELTNRAFESLTRALTDDDPALQRARVQRASLFLRQARAADAVPLLRAAIPHLPASRSPMDETSFRARLLLGRALKGEHDFAAAKSELQSLIDVLEPGGVDRLQARLELGSVLRVEGELQRRARSSSPSSPSATAICRTTSR